MFAIAVDMTPAEMDKHHPKGSRRGYLDIEQTLGQFGFQRVQWSVYAAEKADLVDLTRAMVALRELPWFPASVRDIRAFRIEDGSDFTGFVKE